MLLLILFVNYSINAKALSISKIIDGDTIVLDNNEIVRLIGIDAPEIGQPGYDLAKWFLHYLTDEEMIFVEKDLADRDDYGRLLRYVFLEKNNKMVNELMLGHGLADLRYIAPEAKYYQRLKKAATKAEENNYGLWAFLVFPPGQIRKEDYYENIVSWQEAQNYINQITSIEGIIIDTYDSGKASFLNFQKNLPKTIQLVIFSENYHLSPDNPALYFLNENIRVTGLIQLYKEIPQIIIKSPQQITVIE